MLDSDDSLPQLAMLTLKGICLHDQSFIHSFIIINAHHVSIESSAGITDSDINTGISYSAA